MDILKVLAIIPARGGSKGIKNKNLALLAGKPLITYTINAAKAAAGLDRILVSTDDPAIADAARAAGAEVPFLRPAELARDETPGIEPILHAIRWLEDHEKYQPDYVMCLQPTSPFRTAADIDAAISLAHNGSDAVIGVSPVEQHPYWMKQLNADHTLKEFIKVDSHYARRQDLPQVYIINGAMYLTRRESLLVNKNFYPVHTTAYVMPRERSLDIDTAWDLHLADLIMRYGKQPCIT